jgi:tRNA-specific 2-thiouridylase
VKVKRQYTVFVGMSGGVDSSVAALLLRRRGYDVVGVFLRCYNLDGCAERDAEDARRVAEHIGIPFYVWDFEEEYKKRVVEYMIEGYRSGLTPNPDVECNREIKFGLFVERARRLGADFVATGHYVRIRRTKSRVKRNESRGRIQRPMTLNSSLFTARDLNKDQSYFLWTLGQKELAHCLFPIGEYLKPQVRSIARKAGLPTAEKKDSQGICFLGKVPVADFLRSHIPARRGEIVTVDGHPIGVHEGAHFYTIGQRKGLDLKEKNAALGVRGRQSTKAHYVTAKDVKRNVVVVAEGEDNPALYRKEIRLRNVNFLSGSHSNILQNVGMSVWARVRYRQPLVKAELRVKRYALRGRKPSRTHSSSLMTLHFGSPVRFVAAGQSAVFYTKTGEMLGGGVIS